MICGAGEIRKANVEVDSASRTAPGHGAPSAEVFETIVIFNCPWPKMAPFQALSFEEVGKLSGLWVQPSH